MNTGKEQEGSYYVYIRPKTDTEDPRWFVGFLKFGNPEFGPDGTLIYKDEVEIIVDEPEASSQPSSTQLAQISSQLSSTQVPEASSQPLSTQLPQILSQPSSTQLQTRTPLKTISAFTEMTPKGQRNVQGSGTQSQPYNRGFLQNCSISQA